MQRLGITRPSAPAGSAAARLAPADGHAAGNGHANGHAQAPAAAARTGVDPGDWKVLLAAVTTRLQQIGATAGATNRQACRALLECAQALEQLHATLVDEAGGQRQLQLELFDLRMALAMASSTVADLRDGERRARHDAQHDALTGLPNRRHFRDRLQQALATPSRAGTTLAVLYIDLDEFKPINDLHGHATGDELLRIVASRLARAVRAEDMVSRLGGDEFACLIADMPDPAGLEMLARKLIEIVAAPVALGPLELRVCPSIGIAVSPDDAVAADALLRRADAAMYRAKRTRTGLARFDLLVDDPERISVPSERA